MIHWSYLLLVLCLGFLLGFAVAATLRANDDLNDPSYIYYHDKDGILLRDDGKYIQQYDPESGEWITLN